MERNKNALIQIESFSGAIDTASLFIVYQKLCGPTAIGLYGLLAHLTLPEHFTHDDLSTLLGIEQHHLTLDFEALEQVSLLESYHHPEKDTYLYVVKAPLKISEAINHPVLGRAYLQAVGEGHYTAVKKRYNTLKPLKEGYESISKPFEAGRLRTFDPKAEVHFEPFETVLSGLGFNLLSFKQRCSELVFPQALRTPANLRLIEELGSVYGISVPKMIQLLGDCVNIATMTFDGEKLERLMRKVKEPTVMPEDPYLSDPVQFLRYLQEGKEPTDTEKRLLASLVRDQRLNPEVVNVLVKHALESSNQTLKKSYVETIAASWSRLKISTKDQALAHIQGLGNKQTRVRKFPLKNEVTNYREKVKESMNEEEFNKLKERLRILGEKHGKD